jgi:hypothetical protein
MPYHDEYEDRYSDDYRRRRDVPLDAYEDDDLSWKHSRFGIASFCLALVGGTMGSVMVVIAGILETSTPGILDEEGPEVMMVGGGFILGGLVLLLGLGLGIAGLCESRRKKVFAVLGLALNILALLGIGVLVVIGMLMD